MDKVKLKLDFLVTYILVCTGSYLILALLKKAIVEGVFS